MLDEFLFGIVKAKRKYRCMAHFSVWEVQILFFVGLFFLLCLNLAQTIRYFAVEKGKKYGKATIQ